MKLTIDYDFKTWNEYINAERSNRYYAAKIKKAEKAFLTWTINKEYKGTYPIELIIKPHFAAKRRDLDNFRMKGLIDGLVAAGCIKNDNLTCIQKITLLPVFDKERIVEVEILPLSKEVGNEGKGTI